MFAASATPTASVFVDVLVVLADGAHEFQVLLLFFQLGHGLLAGLQPLLRRCQFVAQPRVLLTQAADLGAQFLLLGFDHLKMGCQSHNHLQKLTIAV
nr:unnamed protein product [Callosobruchus analis]